MARMIGGIGIAHTPSMGMAYDQGMRTGFEPGWQAWYDGTRPVAQWLQERAPTQMIVIYNDHLNHFDFKAYPTFALGIQHAFAQADEGWGRRDLPDLPGMPELGMHLATHLVREADIDLTVCQELTLDHGVYSWMPYLQTPPWRIPVTPLAVNMIREPLPTSRRLVRLGHAIRQAVLDWPAPQERVLVVASGGMSHQISGTRFGMANMELDRYFLKHLPQHMDKLTVIAQEVYMRYGGTEAVELSLWFAMRAALSNAARHVYDYYTFPKITGCGVLIMDDVCMDDTLLPAPNRSGHEIWNHFA